jgi:peptide/nickel transport system substrate-binding protein
MATRRAKDGRLLIGVHYEPSGVDPHINSAELGLQMTMGVFDTLVYKTPEGEYLPGLAESWEISPDERAYTFRLRKDIKFHDGTFFNAAAVKFSFDRARDPANQSKLAGSMLGSYKFTEVVDDYTLTVQLSEPSALFLDSLSQAWLAPVSPTAVEKYGTDFGLHLVGTGPFMFEEWVPHERITLRRNPDYNWAPPVVRNRGPAYLEEVTFVFLPEDSDRTSALESGVINGIFYVPPADVERLRADPAFDVRVWPIRGAPVCMMMNTAREPTSEFAVRKAIGYAVDQDALVEQVFHGEFPRAYGPLSQYTLGYESSVEQMYPYDLQKARLRLQQVGWEDNDGDGIREKDGQKLKVIFYAIPVNYYSEFGQIIQEQLREIGIEVEVRVVPPVEWREAAQRGEHHLIPQGKFISAPHILSYIYHSRYSQKGYGWTKRSSKYRPDLDQLLEEGERTMECEKYVPIYQKVQKMIMEEALIAPFHCNTNIVALRKGINGLSFDAIGAYPYLHDVTIEGM